MKQENSVQKDKRRESNCFPFSLWAYSAPNNAGKKMDNP